MDRGGLLPVRSRSVAAPRALACFAFAADGIGTQVPGLALPAIVADWSIARGAMAAPTALGLLGFAFGALVGGVAGDRWGRSVALCWSLLLTGAALAACALANDVVALGALRLVAGLGLGASLPLAATLLVETVPAEGRNLALALGLSCLPLGGFAAGLGAMVILPLLGWRVLFILGGTLAFAAGLAGLISGLASAAASEGAVARGQADPLRATLAVLLGAPLRRCTLGLWGAFFFTVLIYYSMFSWGPAAFTAAGLGVRAASALMSAFSVGGLLGGLLSGGLWRAAGPLRTLVILSCVAALAAALLPQMVTHPQRLAVLSAALAVMGAAVIGVQTALYSLAAHMYEARQRSTGTGLAVSWGRIGAIVSSSSGVVTLDHGGVRAFFVFIAVAVLLGLACGLQIRWHSTRGEHTARADIRA